MQLREVGEQRGRVKPRALGTATRTLHVPLATVNVQKIYKRPRLRKSPRLLLEDS